MMYPFLQLDDEVEIVHSNIIHTTSGERVRIYIEKPVQGGFNCAECFLPEYTWENIVGFSKDDIDRFQEIIESTSHLIFRFARQGGLGNASNFLSSQLDV